jgi:hypothetical protein
MIKIIGVDPSMTGTGLCAWDGTTSTIKTVAKQRDNRLRVINRAVADIAYTPGPGLLNRAQVPVDLAVVEQVVARQGPAIGALWMVQAAVRMALMDAGVPYAVVNPQHLKAYAGWAKHDKDAMARSAYETDGSVFEDDSQCDAWWLRQMALDRYGLLRLGTRRVSAQQRAWLDKVQWPELETGAAL